MSEWRWLGLLFVALLLVVLLLSLFARPPSEVMTVREATPVEELRVRVEKLEARVVELERSQVNCPWITTTAEVK